AQKKSTELRDEIAKNPTAKKIFDQALVLEGMVRNTGKHAAGIIITDRPLDEFVPLTLQEGDVTVQYDMSAVGKLGLLKMDFLGLKTLTVIADAVENIRRTADPQFDLEKIPFDDARTFALLNSGRTTGVFQLESSGMQALCRQLQVSSIDEIIALIALYRPGPMEWIPDYIRGKKDPHTVKFPHPLIEDVCRETYGVMVYQEQVMEAARVIAGYTLGGADMLRRAMGKKDAEAMAREREKFVDGAKKLHGIDQKTSNAIFDILNKFAGYGFNKSHSAAYAILSYQTGYLKANHPVQFMAAVLSSELGNAEKAAHFIAECEAMGVQVLGPDVNESRENFTPVFRKKVQNPESRVQSPEARSPSTLDSELSTPTEEAAIRFGLAAVKGVGEAAAQKILAERDARGPFRDFGDFAARVDGRAINKRVLEHLIKTGAFDFSGAPRKQLFDRIDEALSSAASAARDKAAGQHSFLDVLSDAPPENGGRASAPSFNSQLSTSNTSASDFSPHDRLTFEKDLLGFYVSGHPMNLYLGLADAIDTCAEDQLLQLPDRAEFRLCGIAGNITKKLSKKDNRPWAAFTLATRRATVPLNMFADAFEACGSHLLENAPVLVQGNVIHGNEGPRLNIKEGYPLEPRITGLARKVTWLLHPDHPELVDFLRRLRTAVDAASGDTRLELAFVFDGHTAPVAEASPGLTWKLTAPSFQELRTHPAVAGAQVEMKKLELKPDRRWGKR
ncbi:MAG: DNA polymerase III subunit alpha, partial [Opitutaceae bacterium]